MRARLRAGCLQSIVASPHYRGHPRFTRVAVVQAEGDEVWRAELRLLFRTHNPASGQLEQLALVKFFVSAGAGLASMPASVLTHTYEPQQPQTATGGDGAGGSRCNAAEGSSNSSSGSVPRLRQSARGRHTGAVRLRFPAAGVPFRQRYQVMPIHNIIRAEHVLTDYHKHGLSGGFEAFYVNPWKFSLENVGDDDGRGELLNIAPL